MLSIFLTMLVVVNGQECLRANNLNGLPPFMDYRSSDLRSDSIPELHQAIITSYRFACCGNITEWGVDVHPAGANHDMRYTLDLQVWRPTPTVQTTGCYSLVGSNRFTSVSLFNGVAMVTPLPQDRINFQRGDVLGFSLEDPNGSDGGVIILIDSSEQGDNGHETEEVWHADTRNAIIGNGLCPFPVGSQPGRVLNTLTSAAPVISVSYGTTRCPPEIAPTTLPAPPQSKPTLPEPSFGPSATNPLQITDSMIDQIEEPPLNANSNNTSFTNNTGLITGITVTALLVVIVIILILVLGLLVSAKLKRYHKNEAAHDSGHRETATPTYDYPTMDNQATDSIINTNQNEAYAAHIEARPNEAYAMSIITERNNAYGTNMY